MEVLVAHSFPRHTKYLTSAETYKYGAHDAAAGDRRWISRYLPLPKYHVIWVNC
jgi:hypothetical protein